MTNLFQRLDATYGTEYIYRQLAEECLELAHAALKVVRAMRNETPVTLDEAQAAFDEEFADVAVMVNCIGEAIDTERLKCVTEIMKMKERRILDRMEGSHDQGQW